MIFKYFSLFFAMLRDIVKQCAERGTVYAFKPPARPTLPTICFIPGFRSDFVTSKKSLTVYDYAVSRGLGFLSWNHADGSVYDWYQDSVSFIQKHTRGLSYLVGASCGLWISLLVAKQMPVQGILGIGGSVNFTERWLINELSEEQRDMNYIWRRPSPYDPKGYYDIPVSFLLESRRALITDYSDIQCERIIMIHGVHDIDAPLECAKQIFNRLGKRALLYQVDQGDHRLSSEKNLCFLREKLHELVSNE
ncbi:hypothetical protein RMATCC62417_11576 [Rhizopus microsporus]|nr:hypothetical protein RMATCC62417_11576 [Rhizopus microsporus]